jgi:CheY-like chemotaxis protein
MTDPELRRMLGAAIRDKRSELGLSQEALSERSGLHRTYISDVERGARNLSLGSIEKLAKALETSVARLFQQAVPAGGVPKSVEILLVEDRVEDIELTLRAFRQARLTNTVHIARDGEQAIEFIFATGRYAFRAGQPQPGVVLLDLNLPTLTGLDVLRKLKGDPRTEAIPVVVLTCSRDYRDAVECRKLGVENYIVKPVDFRNFSELVPSLELDWVLQKPGVEAPAN